MAGAQMSDVGDLGVPFLRGKRCEDFHYLSQTGTTRNQDRRTDLHFQQRAFDRLDRSR